MVKKVKIKVIPPIDTNMPHEVEVKIEKTAATVPEVLAKYCELLRIPVYRYDEILKRKVYTFWTMVLIKNGKVIGTIGIDGPNLEGPDNLVKNGDELAIMGAVEGGIFYTRLKVSHVY
jgi:molybdopterin converting factor small subunit